MKVRTAHSPAALISAVVIDPKKSRRQLYLQNPFLDLQAKEADSAGDSKSGESNSSDDQDESDLSCISHDRITRMRSAMCTWMHKVARPTFTHRYIKREPPKKDEFPSQVKVLCASVNLLTYRF